ncbi:Exocyst complex component 1 [Neolecta irregularis DAH-3]|uniref:Exocyst complex component 1 n=1 Tax=Neolecta irregularis (strain DAH-3) TaxID=1198029 RepID=A0A1U7LIU0_NEOID|nr:Exocyst complex component 1 [Neolecta irregularis DAH-3]|eukprot:OLL22441.1 Exocyst complex component 1 [Neolecta irregularis DAH-3]
MVDEQITPKERENSKSSNQSALLVGIPSRGISKPDEAGGPLETSRSVSPKPGQNFQSRIQPPTPRDVPISKSTPRDPSPGPSEKSQAAYIRDDKSFARHNQGSTNIPSHWTTDPIEKPRSTHPSSRSGGLFPGNPSARPTRSISPANVDPFSTGSVRPTPAPTPSPPNANAINCSTQLQQPPNAPSTASDGDGLFVGFSIRQDRPKGTSFGGTSNSNSDPKAYRFDDIGSTAPDTPLPLDSVPAPWMIKSGQTPVTSTFGSHDLESPSGVGVVSNNDGSHLHRDSVAPEEQLDSVQFGLPDDDCVPDPMFISRYSMKPKQFLPGSSNNALPSGGGTHSHSVLAESAELASQGTTISRTKSLLDQQKSKWAASTYEEESGDLLKEVEDVLEGFDWTSMGNADRLEENLRNELMALEAANVHAIVEGDDRMAGLIEKLGCAIVECDKMDSLLTLYAVELSSLSEDISHIEGQNRGVQVQTANQKGLKSELQGLLEAIAIPVGDIEALAGQQGSDDPDGIHESEKILVKFYKAIRIAEDSSEMNLASMRAVQERRDEYKAESTRFLNRMVNNLGMRFQAQFMNLAKRNTRNPDKGHPVIAPRDLLYTYLNRYTGLILYARMTHWDSYEKLKIKYIQPSQMLFSTDTKELVGAWKAAVRKATPEEAETFFTAAEEKDNAVVEKVSAVRSATIKRGRTFRGKNKKIESSDNIGSFCFKAALDHLVPLITPEQNFIVDFFHMSSRDTRSFIDFVEDHVVENYDANDLMIRRPVEPDSQNAKIVASIMERIFDTLPNELTGLVDHIVKQDQIQVVGILETIEIHLTEWAGTDQDFLLRMLNRLHDRLLGVFERFLVEQLRSIEDTKVSLKRRGVVSFIRIFPSFVSRIESQMIQPDVGDQILDIRETIDEAYQKINTTMFESLQAIAKANNSTNVDPEDKEQLYYHIMMMMNMHYYEVEIESHGNPSLQEFDQKARDLWAEHLGIYTRIVIRRPLGKLLVLVMAGYTLMYHRTFWKARRLLLGQIRPSAFRKLMSNYDHKEVKKGIEALYKRVDKHFGDEEESLQGDMLPTVWKALRAEYISITDRRNRLLRSYYTDQEMDWNTTEIKNWFAKRAI